MIAHGIELDPPAIREYCRKWRITELSVFGSVLRGDFRDDSDIDYLVEFEAGDEWDLFDLFHMQTELEQMTGRKVDLVERSAVERDTNRYRRQGILSQVERVYANLSGAS